MIATRETATETATAAQCRGCGWHSTATNALGNAARHHDATGHMIVVGIHQVVTYGKEQPVPGQLDLDGQEA